MTSKEHKKEYLKQYRETHKLERLAYQRTHRKRLNQICQKWYKNKKSKYLELSVFDLGKILFYGIPTVNSSGHVLLSYQGFRIARHRLLYCVYNTCTLRNIHGYDVHHKDENKLNNSPENLARLTKSEHVSIHKDGLANARCSSAKSKCTGNSSAKELESNAESSLAESGESQM